MGNGERHTSVQNPPDRPPDGRASYEAAEHTTGHYPRCSWRHKRRPRLSVDGKLAAIDSVGN